MCDLQCIRHFHADFQHFIQRQRTFSQPLRDRLPFEQLHHQVVDSILRADVVEVANVGMIQGGDSPGLTLQPLPQLRGRGKMGGKNFDGHLAVQASVVRAIHFAHAACSKRCDDFVRSKFCAGGEGHE